MDVHSWFLLLEAASVGVVHHPPVKTMRDALGGAPRRQALDRLLETGALRAKIVKLTSELLSKGADKPFEELVAYEVTELGRAVAQYGTREFGFDHRRSSVFWRRRLTQEKAPTDQSNPRSRSRTSVPATARVRVEASVQDALVVMRGRQVAVELVFGSRCGPPGCGIASGT